MSWIYPSFDETSGPGEHQKMARTRHPSTFGIKRGASFSVWSDVYEPKIRNDLAVNHRKVDEVETWLHLAFTGRLGKAPIALLTGPSGSGKTITVKVLSKSMGFYIKEWVTPGKAAMPKDHFAGSDKIWFESQVAQFEEYIFRASRYPCIAMPRTVASNSIILVEDIPNAYIHDTTLFEKTLEKYTEFGFCPMVIICSTGPPEFNLERLLFKDKVIKELNISKISFNRLGKRIIKYALKRIIQEAQMRHVKEAKQVTDDMLIEAVESSHCDLRSAINHLQYLLCGKRVFRKRTEVANVISRPLVGRDQFHDIFRHAGRVLYSKRVNVNEGEGEGAIPKQRFLHDPDEIVGSVTSVPNLFLNLLNENYVSIFTDMKKIAEASEYLTHSDILMSKSKGKYTDVCYSLQLAVMGLMKCSNVGINRTWLPLRSSKSKHALAACAEKMENCLLHFPEKLNDRKILMKEVLPYCTRMDLSEVESDKKNFIMSFAGWNSCGFKFSPAEDNALVDDINESCDSSFGANVSLVRNEEKCRDVTYTYPTVKPKRRDTGMFFPQEEEEESFIEDYDSN